MRTGATTGSGHETRVRIPSGGSAATGQWWKAWVLLTGLGATVLGWMAFAAGGPPAAPPVVASDARLAPTQAEPVRYVSGLEQPRPLPSSATGLPAVPQKPVFQTPVTRTRRS